MCSHQSVVSCNKLSQFWGAAYLGLHVSGILTVLLGPFPTTQHCGKLTPQVVFRTFVVSFGVGVLLIREAIRVLAGRSQDVWVQIQALLCLAI